MKSAFQSYGQYREHLIKALSAISDVDIEAVVSMIMDTHERGGFIYVIGNGGSASTASHMSCDLNKGASLFSEQRLRVLSLTDNMAHFSALANDENYDNVFAGQLRNLVTENDMVIGISASGNSANCVAAFQLAKERGATIVGLLGFSGGAMAGLADFSIIVDSNEYGPVEDAHLVINHIVTERLKDRLQL